MVFATKKTGRPPTGIGTPIQVRLSAVQLEALDGWIEDERAALTGDNLSRPEAIRRLMVEALQRMGRFPVRERE